MNQQEQKEFQELRKSVDKILFHLESDADLGHKGIPERLKCVEKGLEQIQHDKLILRGKLTAYGVLGGAATFLLGTGFKWLLAKLSILS